MALRGKHQAAAVAFHWHARHQAAAVGLQCLLAEAPGRSHGLMGLPCCDSQAAAVTARNRQAAAVAFAETACMNGRSSSHTSIYSIYVYTRASIRVSGF